MFTLGTRIGRKTFFQVSDLAYKIIVLEQCLEQQEQFIEIKN